MHKRQNQSNPSGIKCLTEVDMPSNKTQTQLIYISEKCVNYWIKHGSTNAINSVSIT